MKKYFILNSITEVALLTLWMVGAVSALTHSIQLQARDNVVHDPKPFFARVGDTIRWEGDFTRFPMKSKAIPESAPSWAADSGTSFSYEVIQAGTYTYSCYTGVGGVSTRSFTAVGDVAQGSLQSDDRPTLQLGAIEQNPAKVGRQIIRYEILVGQKVKLTMYDEAGKVALSLVSGWKEPGNYVVELPFHRLKPGFYDCKLEGINIDTRTLHLEKVMVPAKVSESDPVFHIER